MGCLRSRRSKEVISKFPQKFLLPSPETSMNPFGLPAIGVATAIGARANPPGGASRIIFNAAAVPVSQHGSTRPPRFLPRTRGSSRDLFHQNNESCDSAGERRAASCYFGTAGGFLALTLALRGIFAPPPFLPSRWWGGGVPSSARGCRCRLCQSGEDWSPRGLRLSRPSSGSLTRTVSTEVETMTSEQSLNDDGGIRPVAEIKPPPVNQLSWWFRLPTRKTTFKISVRTPIRKHVDSRSNLLGHASCCTFRAWFSSKRTCGSLENNFMAILTLIA